MCSQAQPSAEQLRSKDTKVVRGEISSAQWEVARTLIQTLYIEENKPLSYVVEALRTEHGFCPTKRQFNRKVSEQWGMKKNSNISQRRAVIQRLESETMGSALNTLQIDNRNINILRVRRWRNELGKEVALERPLLFANRTYTSSMQEETEIDPIVADTEVSHPSVARVIEDPSPTDAAMDTPQSGTLGDEFSTIWHAARVEDSPEVTCLLAAFHISGFDGSREDIPPLSLSHNDSSELQEGIQFLSADDIRNLHIPPVPTEMLESQKNTSESTYVVPYYQPGSHKQQQQQQQANDADKFEQLYQVIENLITPFDEIYPFPTCTGKVSAVGASSANSTLCQINHIACEEQLEKLSQIMSDSDPALILTMENLANLYLGQGKYKQAESLIRRVIVAKNGIWGAGGKDTLSSCLSLLDILNFQGLYKQAESLHWQIHAAILIGSHDHDILVARSLLLIACAKNNLGQYEDAERFNRQALQLNLNHRGPKHPNTFRIIGNLASTLRDRGQMAPSEKLLRITLQLQDKVTGLDEAGVCMNMSNLAWVLQDQKKMADSIMLYRRALERSKLNLGEKHPETLINMGHLAAALMEQGDLRGGMDTLVDIIPQLVKELGDKHRETLKAMADFADALFRAQNFREAGMYYGKVFAGRTDNWGVEHESTLRVCHWLGKCYENQGLYNEALQLYLDTLDKVDKTGEDGQSKAARLNEWMAELNLNLAEREEQEDNHNSNITSFGVAGE